MDGIRTHPEQDSGDTAYSVAGYSGKPWYRSFFYIVYLFVNCKVLYSCYSEIIRATQCKPRAFKAPQYMTVLCMFYWPEK